MVLPSAAMPKTHSRRRGTQEKSIHDQVGTIPRDHPYWTASLAVASVGNDRVKLDRQTWASWVESAVTPRARRMDRDTIVPDIVTPAHGDRILRRIVSLSAPTSRQGVPEAVQHPACTSGKGKRRRGRSRAAPMQLTQRHFPHHWRPRCRTWSVFRPNPRPPVLGRASDGGRASKCCARPTYPDGSPQVYPVRGDVEFCGHAVRAELAQHMPMFVCISSSAHRSYIHRCMHSGSGFLVLPRTRPPVGEEVAHQLSRRQVHLDPLRSTTWSPIARCLRNLPLGLGRRWAGRCGSPPCPFLGAWSFFCGRTCGPTIGRPGGRGSSDCS